MKFRSFKYLVVEGLKNIWVNRLMSVASIVVLVACMLLIGAAFLFTLNVEEAMGTLQDNNVVLVYMEDNTTQVEAETVEREIAQLDNVKTTLLKTPEDGMNEIIDSMGDSYEELFTVLEDEDASFLPYGVQVSFDDAVFQDLRQYSRIIDEIEQIDKVDHINESYELTQRISGIQRVVNVAGFWVIALLLVTALVIIANTIRITMNSRKLEISIMKAVGATNNFVRFPFVVEGMVFGLISAALSTGILYFAYRMTINQVQKIMSFDAIGFSQVWWQILVGFCVIGVLAGCLGSLISIGKYLRREGSALNVF